MTPTITYGDFEKVDMRVGKVVEVHDFERARAPSYKLRIDFGPELGLKWSSAQAKASYTREELVDRLVIAVVNFVPKNIAGFMSEVLVLGVPAEDGAVSLLEPTRGAMLGGRVY